MAAASEEDVAEVSLEQSLAHTQAAASQGVLASVSAVLATGALALTALVIMQHMKRRRNYVALVDEV